MKPSFVLKTGRLRLREISEADAETIVALRSDPEIYRFFLNPHRISIEEHLNWYRSRYVFDADRYDWAGEDEQGAVAGVFGAIRRSDTEAEVNYILQQSHYGKGYAKEAVERIIEFCSEWWNSRQIVATIHKDNAQSIRFAEKLGFSCAESIGSFLVFRYVPAVRPKSKRVYFRADANPNIGMGHLMRCLSLADTAEQRAVFVLADPQPERVVNDRGYETIVLHTDYRSLEAELPFWEKVTADAIVVDSYAVTGAYLNALRKRARLIYLDDLASFPYPVDVLVNYNTSAELTDYTELYRRAGAGLPRLLLGPKYAPLRPMFLNAPRYKPKRQVHDVLLSTGGADPEHIALRFVEAGPSGYVFHLLIGLLNPDRETIRQVAANNRSVVIHENVTEIRRLIEQMDLAVSAAGSTLYELCACGVPLITYAIADNQLPGAEAFGRLKLAETIGDLRAADHPAEEMIAAVKALAADYERRVEMSERMQRMIDGKGASRIWLEAGLTI